MAFAVRFTIEARKDLRELHAYISEADTQASANYVVRGIIRAALTLQEMPQRGTHPAELAAMGNKSYRQILFKPYRIFYRVRGKTAFVGLIADGRRNMTPLLSRRLVKA